MKLLYIITLANWGGAQAQLYSVVKHAKELGHKCVVVIGETGELVNRLSELDVKVIILPNLIREINPFKDFRCIFELVQIIKKEKPDLLHAHSSKAGIVGRIAAKLTHTPNVFTAHGWAFTEGVAEKKRKLFIFIERFVALFTNKIICVSNYDRDLAINNKVGTNQKLVTIHNGVEDKGTELNKVLNKVPRIIMVARFTPPKDYETLILALGNIKGDYEACFVGGGQLLSPMKSLATELNLNQKIKFLGERKDVDDLLEQSDIFVLCSNYEGLPISIIEAMSNNIPVIATNVGGVKELVEDNKTGFLVNRKDVQVLAKRLQYLIDNNNERLEMGRAGYEKFYKEFTLDNMLNQTFLVYHGVLNKS